MNKPILSLLILFGIIVAACGNKEDDGTFFPNAPVHPDKAKLVQLVSDLRATGQNCGGVSFAAAGAVTWNDTLALVARKHSADMAANDKLSHTGTDGSFVDERITREGYVFAFYAENLLKGSPTEEDAIAAWKNSAAHCENLMDPNIDEIGVGTSGPYWTMVLASH